MKRKNILELSDKYEIFVLDLYGVVWKGTEFFPQALHNMLELKKQGKTIILLSNYPCRSETVEKIWTERGMVKNVHYDELVTSGEAFYDEFSCRKKAEKYWLLGWHPLDIFEGTDFVRVQSPEDADFIFAGEPMREIDGVWREQTSIDFYKKELDYLLKLDKPMCCANPDKISHSNDTGGIAVRAGALAEYYQNNGGNVSYVGKPQSSFVEFAIWNYTDDKSSVLMVGDTLEMDILGGNNYGIDTALTLCGMSVEDMRKDGFEDIEAYAAAKGIIPTHYIDYL